MIVNTANAAPSTGGFDFLSLLPLVLIFGIFYFFVLRPQNKKAREHQQMLSQLRRHDRVVTSGGIIGTIHKVIDDREVSVEISEGVRVRVMRSMITSVIAKTDAESPKNEQKDV